MSEQKQPIPTAEEMQYLADKTEEAAKILFEQRDQMCAFYDARVLFAVYGVIIGHLAADLRTTGVYSPSTVFRLMLEHLHEGLFGESKVKLMMMDGKEGHKGSKQ